MRPDFFHRSLEDLAALGTLFSGLTLALLVGFTKRPGQRANLFLSLALGVIVLKTGGLSAAFLPALGPLLFFYTKHLTRPEWRFQPKDWLHFCPLLGGYWMPVWPILLSVILYLYSAHRLIQAFYARLQPVLMDRPRFAFRGLDKALVLLGWSCLFTLVSDTFFLAMAVVLMTMAVEVILKLDNPVKLAMPIADRSDARQKGRKLKEAVAVNHLYEDAELTLTTLALKLGIHPHELSRIINLGLAKNFSDFINEFRVREIARKMRDPAYDRLTLLGIAYESGFNSKTTFNRVFKEMTGKTPVDYKNSVKKEVPIDELAPQLPIQPLLLRSESPPTQATDISNRNLSSLHPSMLRNHLKIAFRTLSRNKLYTGLNMAGLALGITCFLLIGLYLFDELTFDQQHSNASRIYRVVEHKAVKGEATTTAAGSYKLAEESKKTVAEVENTTRVSRPGRANLINPENPVNFQETITNADENFLQLFDFPLLVGDKTTALKEPNSIVVNEELAMRLFGNTQVLGKTLQFSHMESPLKVTGVLKNHPRNSSFDFNSLVSEASFHQFPDFKQTMASDWSSTSFSVYVLLKPNTNAEAVSTKLTKLVLANVKPEVGTSLSFSLQALNDMHLYSEGIADGARNSNVEALAQGSPFYIRIFSLVALFVLCIAGINYMNLATARASNRLKEIGVRKSIGAERSSLIDQFLVEALLITGLSLLLALVLVNVILPFLNPFVNKQLTLGFATDYRIWLMTLAATLLIGLLSGSYPALLLSGFKPALLLKGMKINQRGSLSLRKALVVFQFTISTVLIIGTIVLFWQVRFMNTANLGFNKDLLVVIDVNTGAARERFETIKAGMANIASVKQVSVTSRVPGEWKTIRRVKINTQGKADDLKVAYLIGADKDFMNTFAIKLLQGRNFVNPADSSAVLLNETAARLLNITEPSDQPVEMPAMARESEFQPLNTPFKARVVGIVKDFHFQSLHDKIEPLVVAYNHNPIHRIDYYTTRIDAKGIPETLEKLKAVMVKADPDEPFEYHFLDQQLALFYLEDARRQTLLIWVALATIFIACLGLFGLATYSAEQRIKEIGVRKVLGASVVNLTSMLSMDFLKLVLIANGIAFPLAWWATNQWLQEYAYHIDLAWWMFALAGLLAVGIALLTVSYQAIKAALVNPVKSLRSE